MTFDEARTAIYSRFISEWGTRTAYILEGEDGDEPGVDVEWARVAVRETDSAQESLGAKTNRKYERQLSVFVQIFTPAIRGMQASGQHAERAREIFEGERLGPQLWLNNTTITDIPLPAGEKSRQTNVEIIGAYEEIK